MLLLSTSSLKWYWLHKIFSIVKKSRFSWIDLVLDENNYDTQDLDYILSLTEEFWVKVLSITAYNKSLDKENIDKIIKMSEVLETQIVTFSPPHIKDKNIDFYVNYLKKIKSDTLKSISIKNIEQKFMFFIIPEYKNANLVDIKNITWDTSLSLDWIDSSTWIDIIKAYDILWNSIKNIYLADKSDKNMWLLPWKSIWWISYLPIESFLMKTKVSWYSWFFSLKVVPKELWIWNEEIILENLWNFKKYFDKYFTNHK